MWPVKITLTLVIFSRCLFAQQTPSAPRIEAAKGEQGLGNPAKGLDIFQGKGICVSCHRVANVGSLMGPDLSEIATQHTADELRRAILDPSPVVQPRYQIYRIVTRKGKTYTGKILNQDEFSVQMVCSDTKLRAFSKSDLAEYAFQTTPPMPSYRGKFSQDEESDLVAFLLSLKAPSPNSAK